MVWVAGVNGCREGWVAVLVEHGRRGVNRVWYRRCDSFQDILNLAPPPEVTAVDIPIGLLDAPSVGGRECDRLARRILGRPRSSSVCSPPIRSALRTASDEAAASVGLTRQSLGLLQKVSEVDSHITLKIQRKVFEVHPEGSFSAMGGSAMKHDKRSRLGRDERLGALAPFYPRIKNQIQVEKPRGVGIDDLLDAYALAWTAMRIASGKAKRIPKNPPLDARGLRMEIWY